MRTDAQGCEHVAGLCTLYTPFHPIKDRLRLSQVLVMPPFQGLGVGKALVKVSCGGAGLSCFMVRPVMQHYAT